jgi:UDPglucose--hexose-1-phosphate uridylyltransferase
VAGELRHDPLVDDWVAIAGHRQDRTFLPPRDECPLCPTGRGTVPSEIPEISYDVVVFENRFPSFSDQGAVAAAGAELLAGGRAHGRCEVVCFTSDHDASFAALSPARVRTVIEAWADRTAELSRIPGVEHVFCFENRGPEIGVTLHHPHGQIYAYPFVPARSASLLAAARRHHERTGRLLGADILAAEQADGSRMVIEGEHWSAYVPYAARWPVEVHLAPHRDVPDLPSLTGAERDELAEVHQQLFRGLDRYYVSEDGGAVALPYISAWHQAPVREGRDVSRLHLQVMSVLRSPGRLKYLAGSESAVGGWINDVPPERTAERLREVVG